MPRSVQKILVECNAGRAGARMFVKGTKLHLLGGLRAVQGGAVAAGMGPWVVDADSLAWPADHEARLNADNPQ